jgi:hydrogenase maturation protein HypF
LGAVDRGRSEEFLAWVNMSGLVGANIHVTGVVQGVGFRPFIYGLATRLELTGWVRNTSAGVDIVIDGSPTALSQFVKALREDSPPLARIDTVSVQERPCDGFASFKIVRSEAVPGAYMPISPDVAICSECLHELFDPNNRRYHYPFINCTNCGPRFTIIQDIPYDRPKTTMAPFKMCPECESEYANPLDRRFHAQPVACHACGPQVWLESREGKEVEREQALEATRLLLVEGKIVAVKGLGGFHLACDAANPDAVRELRRRKLRVDKPFGLMMADLATVESNCLVDDAERHLLSSRERPIVILRRKAGSSIAPEVAPGQDTVGVMLPYTPLHYLILAEQPDTQTRRSGSSTPVLVMTSGNLSEEPIAIDNQDARDRLGCIADAFLMHDRDIRTRCDDSVARSFVLDPSMSASPTRIEDAVYFLRRSRGYAPFPIPLPFEVPPILAAGAELKNAFCLARDRYAFQSQHIGDLQNYETLGSFEDGVSHFERLFRIQPEILAYDLHPDYLATRYCLDRAEREGMDAVGVQHHHAHIASCMAENGLHGDRPVIGVSFDGTGFGEDGAIWGGEFLLSDYHNYRRPFHLEYVGLPGGDKAAREPWRIALAWLYKAGIDWDESLPPVGAATPEVHRVVWNQIERSLNCPLTSSMGRLFDAASALAGVRQSVNYEAQAAIEFEALADENERGAYHFGLADVEGMDSASIAVTPVIRAIVADLRAGTTPPIISARFHNGLAYMVWQVCRTLRERTGLSQVALSGGVWQNMTLLRHATSMLKSDGFTVLVHHLVPANDGGLALGQAVIAAFKIKKQ